MGGLGSGRQDQRRNTGSVENATRIDIRAVTKSPQIRNGHWFHLETPEAFKLYARISDDLLQIAQLRPSETHLYAELRLENHPRHFGGHQNYLLCPHCKKSASILYLVIPKELGCRTCLKLAYESQYYKHPAPLLVRANKLREKLGGTAGLINPLPDRPKGMHWNTYMETISQIRELESLQISTGYTEMAAARKRLSRLSDRYGP